MGIHSLVVLTSLRSYLERKLPGLTPEHRSKALCFNKVPGDWCAHRRSLRCVGLSSDFQLWVYLEITWGLDEVGLHSLLALCLTRHTRLREVLHRVGKLFRDGWVQPNDQDWQWFCRPGLTTTGRNSR